jgi:fumarate hydratase subunit beta
MIQIEMPFTSGKIKSLKVGDQIEVSGIFYTARDAVHKWLYEGNKAPFDLKDAMIYHCGPVTLRQKKKWTVTAAGPTTSMREEPYMAKLIELYQLKGVIGKGGMGEKTRLACEKFGCVYLHAVGGAAQVLAEQIKEVQDVFGIEEFGAPEAIWKLRVEKFPVVVTIDAHGNSLHRDIESTSKEIFERLVPKK